MQKKAIRHAQKGVYERDKKQIQEKAVKRAVSSPKTNRAIRGKALSKKKSHKTSPADVTWETEPDSIHREGNHWIKTLQKQTTHLAMRLSRQLQKWRHKR